MIPNFSEHAANERTFLAWFRTVLATVGFGLALSRIGGGVAPAWSEFALLSMGAIVIALCFVRLRLLRKGIDAPTGEAGDGSMADGLLVAILLGFLALIALFVLHVA